MKLLEFIRGNALRKNKINGLEYSHVIYYYNGDIMKKVLYKYGIPCDTITYNLTGGIECIDIKNLNMSGNKTCYDSNRIIDYTCDYKNGQKHGNAINYNNGIKQYIKPYVNGQLHGIVITYHLNGDIARECSYVQDQKHGIERFYVNGMIRSEIGYHQNKRYGLEIHYRGGVIDYQYEWVDDILVQY